MNDFAGRIAIVTGAANGLGRAHALGLAKEGATVIVCDLSAEACNSVVREIIDIGGSAMPAPADVGNDGLVDEMVAQIVNRYGRVDILVNNAGILRDRSFGKMTIEDFDEVIKVHLRGSFNCTRAVWNTMKAARYGRILFTSSASGIYGNFGQANYGAAKAAMIGLMNVLHIEGAKYNIRVNSLAPAAATQMTRELISPEAATLLDPSSVTPAMLYLTSESAPSRMIMGAGAGVFAVTHIQETEGEYLTPEERTPEGIASRLSKIADPTRATELDGAFHQIEKFAALAARATA